MYHRCTTVNHPTNPKSSRLIPSPVPSPRRLHTPRARAARCAACWLFFLIGLGAIAASALAFFIPTSGTPTVRVTQTMRNEMVATHAEGEMYGQMGGRLFYVWYGSEQESPVDLQSRRNSNRDAERSFRQRRLIRQQTTIATENTSAGAMAEAKTRPWPSWRTSSATSSNSTWKFVALSAPLWQLQLLLAAIGTTLILLTRRGLFPPRPGHCPNCRYDRTGLSSQTPCPECGSPPLLSARRAGNT